jgi:protein-S-isoprenylcysteine O-methyltransferase Ste14
MNLLAPAIKFSIFLLASFFIAFLSRKSLKAPKSHGFYRFFAWETILALFLLNLHVWFGQPFSWHQLISWLLLIASAFLVIHAVLLLKQIGKSEAQSIDDVRFDFEKTTTLITVGAYRYIRHPMYSSLLLLAWGIFFKQITWFSSILVVIATIFLILTAKAEERENIGFFGIAYQEYMAHTKMFVPFLF